MLVAMSTVVNHLLTLPQRQHAVYFFDELVDMVEGERAKVVIVAVINVGVVYVDHLARGALDGLRPCRAKVKLACINQSHNNIKRSSDPIHKLSEHGFSRNGVGSLPLISSLQSFVELKLVSWTL